MTLTLCPGTIDNWPIVIDLKVASGQEEFVASNPYSLAESKFGVDYLGHWDLFPLAIYGDENIVGFFMHGFNYGCEKNEGFLFRLMIAVPHQSRGYGRAAMQMIFRKLDANEHITKVGISNNPRNRVAQKLYASLGFVETGEVWDGELLPIYQNNGLLKYLSWITQIGADFLHQ